MKKINLLLALLLVYLLAPALLQAQTPGEANATKKFTLTECVEYALDHQPVVKQSLIDEDIVERDIRSSLSGWLPQITARYTAVHNIIRQKAVFGDNVVTLGTNYNSNILLQAEQTLYNNELALASRAARISRLQVDQNTENTKINTVVEVSKAFYAILIAEAQLNILDENIARQEKQYKDARSQYESGLVDKTDYQRASITLANSRSDKKRTLESIKALNARLKQLMGYPVESELSLQFDYAQMERQAVIDTTQTVAYNNRIEFKQVQTQQQLLKLNTSYFKWGFLPVVSAYINYNPLFFSNSLPQLYDRGFPTSAVGLQASIPIFQGTRRIQNLRRAQLQEQRVEVALENTRNIIHTEYQTALASYKSNYNEWITLRENAQMAKEVYDVIKLQYDEGVKAYIDLIVAETDLKTTQLNYLNALNRVLSSKLDLERALGNININQ